MSSFCRITGKSRDMPKPNFFPIIPPISPADARKLCKITGRRMDDHNFVPLLEFGKRPECVRCRVTGSGKVRKEMPPEEQNEAGEIIHNTRDDYKYVAPILRKEVIEKEYQKSFEELQKLLKRLKTSGNEENDKYFVYLLESVLCGIIVPQEVEEAIRLGEIESLSISKNLDKAIFKMKGRPTMFIPLKESDINKVVGDSRLYNGKGQNKETLGRQKKVLEDKKKKMFATRKIFEDLEKAADEELLNDQDRPKGKARIFGGISKEAKQYRQKLADFREMYTPQGNMALYGDWKNALKIDLDKLNWEKIGNLKSVELEGPLPKQAKLSPPDDEDMFSDVKRLKNIYDPGMWGVEFVPAVEEVIINKCSMKNEIIDFVKISKEQRQDTSSSLKTIFKDDDALRILPFLDEFLQAVKKMESPVFYLSHVTFGYIYDEGDGVKFSEDKADIPHGSNTISGAIVKMDSDGPFWVPGEQIKIDGETKFLPGQRMVDGEFIPGASIRTKDNEFKFLPGLYFESEGEEGCFVLGQLIEEPSGEVVFRCGQVAQTRRGAIFVEGQSQMTADGLKMVAGVVRDTEIGPQFTCGALVDMGEETRFLKGQMLGGTSKEPLQFIAGEMGEIMEKQVFVPCQTVTTPEGKKVRLHGQMVEDAKGQHIFLHGDVMVNNKNQVQFMMGQLVYNEEKEKDEFIPGIIADVDGCPEFIEGRFIKKDNDEVMFVPGKTTVFVDGVANRFDTAKDKQNITLQKSPSSAMLIDCNNLSMIFKKYRANPGVMIRTKDGKTKFYPDGKVPDDIDGEIIEGRMEYNKDGPVFVSGRVMEINGVKTFIPGKIMKDINGEDIFCPGKEIQTKNGPKFCFGQVIETMEGEKFICGKIMEGPDGSPIFVPGQMIETKSGSLFIPGQAIQTDSGMKHVPGMIVETESGAVFVPAQVIDGPDGCRMVLGEVVDTPEGPRLLPANIGDTEYCVQGFDISQEEMKLLLGSSSAPVNVSDILSGAGGSSVAGEALKALAAGFRAYKSKDVISIVGEKEEEGDIDKIMEDELLDMYDSPNVRQIIKAVFIATFAEICDNIEEVINVMDDYMCDNLGEKLENTIMSKMKLNPAIENLKKIFQEKNSNDPQEFEIMNLISGIISCSIPGALKECCDNGEDIEERQLKAVLLDCIEESIRNILQEEGVISKGLIEDIKELIQLAKELEFEGNESFFSKVAAVSEGRCSSKFMNELIKNFKEKASLPNFGFDMKDLLARLTQILSPRMLLQQGFHIMSGNMPDLVKDVLSTLKCEIRDIEGNSALDILHYAIGKIMNLFTGDELNYFMGMMEQDPEAVRQDKGVADLIQQAVGLANYMNKSETAAALAQILTDPEKFHAVKADPIVVDILRKLFCMRKLAERDPDKRERIAKLQKYSPADKNDMILRELFEMSDLLLRPPYDIKSSKQLKKSRSMIKASKSMIMSSKDIPMNAFLAMKTTADKKDEGWLQNFLTESVVDEVPWECSKALIILKEGYQAIIPREASRSILLGEASYTLIDDNGIEFFLSPMDKKKRREKGMDENPSAVKKDPSFSKSRNKPTFAQTIIEEEEEEEEFPKPKKSPAETKLMDEDDLSLFTKKKPKTFVDSDDEDLGFERPTFNKKVERSPLGMPEDNFDMDKYRPHNYEISRPKGDDINDLMDYYSKYKTTRNALNRTNVGGARFNNDYYDDPSDDFRAMNIRQKKFSDPEQQYYGEDDQLDVPPQAPPRKKYSDPEDYSFERRRPSREFGDNLDPATRLILMKNDDSGTGYKPKRFDDEAANGDSFSRPNFGNQSRYGGAGSGGNFDDDMGHLRPSPPATQLSSERGAGDTAMSSHTRMMLDKLKQSTAELQEVTDGNDDMDFKPATRRTAGGMGSASRQQKKSRFLRNNVNNDVPLYEEDNDSSNYINSLANNVLGLRNDTMGDFDRFRPDPMRISPPKRHSRKSFDLNDDIPAAPSRKFVDDDDTDAMIANLKQKTTRRAATDILRDIEQDTTNDFVKFEPIKSFKDTYKPSPEPEMNKYGSLNRMQPRQQPKKSYLDQDETPNPFSSLRKFSNNGVNGSGGRSKKFSFGAEDDDDMGGYGRQQQAGNYGNGAGQYGSMGRNGMMGQPQQQQQYMPPQQQQQQPMYGQADMMGGGYGGDLYGGGMQAPGGMYGGFGGPQQQYPPQYGGQPAYYGGGMPPQPQYDQMGGFGQQQQPMGNMGGYGQQQQMPGANLRQARHQRYGGAGSGGW